MLSAFHRDPNPTVDGDPHRTAGVCFGVIGYCAMIAIGASVANSKGCFGVWAAGTQAATICGAVTGVLAPVTLVCGVAVLGGVGYGIFQGVQCVRRRKDYQQVQASEADEEQTPTIQNCTGG